MKIILFRSNNIFDSRVNKYHNYYEREGIDYTIVGWDRKGEVLQKKHYDFFRFQAGEDVGGLKAMRNHFKWMCFVFKYLKKHKDVTTIHACDLNTAFPAALFKSFHKRQVTLIFDVCDWFSANFVNKRILSWLFDKMEKYTCKWADELIICEPERESQIQFKLNKAPLIMPNIPEIDQAQITSIQPKYKFNNDNVTIAYMGFFGDSRFLLEILALAETEPFNLLIAGYGNKDVMEKCNLLNNRDNVKYFGRVNMVDGLNMENAADVIYAMYCTNIPNHVYAAPNKYYEALLLGKPLITTKGTIPGIKVERYDTGWAVEEDKEKMRFLINHIDKKSVMHKGQNAKKLWNETYKDYITSFFSDDYAKIIH